LEAAPGGGVVLTLEVAGLPEVCRWVLGFGGEAEVLAPADLREEVHQSGAAIRSRYEYEGGDSEEAQSDAAEGLTLNDNAGS
jgi:predicted DNA-binding transcriptional regulator YafY